MACLSVVAVMIDLSKTVGAGGYIVFADGGGFKFFDVEAEGSFVAGFEMRNFHHRPFTLPRHSTAARCKLQFFLSELIDGQTGAALPRK